MMMTDLWTPVILALISALLGGAVPAILSYRATNRRLTEERDIRSSQAGQALSDAQESLSHATREQIETVMGMLGRMRETQDLLTGQIQALDKQVCYLRGRVTLLIRVVKDLYQGALKLVEQIEELGEDPAWRPDPSIEKIIKASEETGDE